jgi:hypothetical protein
MIALTEKVKGAANCKPFPCHFDHADK